MGPVIIYGGEWDRSLFMAVSGTGHYLWRGWDRSLFMAGSGTGHYLWRGVGPVIIYGGGGTGEKRVGKQNFE